MDLSQIDYSQIIIETLNKLFNQLFLSIDEALYGLLDKIVFIDENIINDSFFEKAFGSAYQIGIISNLTDYKFKYKGLNKLFWNLTPDSSTVPDKILVFVFSGFISKYSAK